MRAAANIFVSLGLNKKDTAVRKEAKLLKASQMDIDAHIFDFVDKLTYDTFKFQNNNLRRCKM
jgi:hypothetical protein